eukprot:1137188-Pelagomonas_calceolata.AAC.3
MALMPASCWHGLAGAGGGAGAAGGVCTAIMTGLAPMGRVHWRPGVQTVRSAPRATNGQILKVIGVSDG